MNENIPDNIVQLVYGQLGFNPQHTVILAYRPLYVLLVTAGRETSPYSIVNVRTHLTEGRWDDLGEAQQALDEYAAGTYRFRPPEET